MIPTSMLILWLSGIASAFVDNIPFVATMIPMIHDMGQMMNISDPNTINLFLVVALSLGACLGGNGTIIGASANVVVIGMAEKRSMPITFMQFFKIGFPLMLLSLVICVFGDLVTIIGTSIFGVLLILASIPINKSLNKLRIHG